MALGHPWEDLSHPSLRPCSALFLNITLQRRERCGAEGLVLAPYNHYGAVWNSSSSPLFLPISNVPSWNREKGRAGWKDSVRAGEGRSGFSAAPRLTGAQSCALSYLQETQSGSTHVYRTESGTAVSSAHLREEEDTGNNGCFVKRRPWPLIQNATMVDMICSCPLPAVTVEHFKCP